MPNFHYRAITQTGELVAGTIAAPNIAEVERRIEYLRLVPIENISEEPAAGRGQSIFAQRVRTEDVTSFTQDLALLLKAGVRLEQGLELLARDADIGRLKSTVDKVRQDVLAGESFSDSLAKHPSAFPATYLSLIRVGESSGTLERILELLARDRQREELLRRRLGDALRYPAFLFFASVFVLVFFLTFVLPQFAGVLRDFEAKPDSLTAAFISVSDFLHAHKGSLGVAVILVLTTILALGRNRKWLSRILAIISHLPIASRILTLYRTALFFRNLHVLLTAVVPMTSALRILAKMMSDAGGGLAWNDVVDRVRQGEKLSVALSGHGSLPPLALRMLRIGEDSGQLAALAERVADYYETKLQRSLDRAAGIAGPAAIMAISTIVGGLIVSVMTSLLSVTQLVG